MNKVKGAQNEQIRRKNQGTHLDSFIKLYHVKNSIPTALSGPELVAAPGMRG